HAAVVPRERLPAQAEERSSRAPFGGVRAGLGLGVDLDERLVGAEDGERRRLTLNRKRRLRSPRARILERHLRPEGP
ncbi:hypothetical protein ABTN35_21035, partial [Acinetobacter baumannii]